MFERLDGYLGGIKVLFVRPEANCGSGIGFAYLANHLEFAALLAASERHVVFLPAAPNPDFEILRQGIDDRHTNPMQAA